MSDSEEETYSTMFTSLKHPARRKILRMLGEKPKNFSLILEELEISSSHLTYHLDKIYPGNIDRIGFGIWADTGEFSAYKTMSPG